MTEKRYDVAIIGAGPAGSSAAIKLAGKGVRVALFEAQTFPHEKLCGEFLSPECKGLLRELGLIDAFLAMNPARINRARITAPDGEIWQTGLPGEAWGLSRKWLDAGLARHAQSLGVDLWEGNTVKNVAGNLADGFQIEGHSPRRRFRVLSRAVIGAFGKRSALDRALGRDFVARSHPFLALKAHFAGPALSNRVELHAFPGGYCGLSEIEEDMRTVCMLVHLSVFRQNGGARGNAVEKFIEWIQTQNGHLHAWFAHARKIQTDWISISQVPFVRKQVVVNDILMVGDSAALFAPLIGDGIAAALEGGILLADYVAECLNGTISAQALKSCYRAAWGRKFSGRLRLSSLLQSIMLKPDWISSGLRLLKMLPGIGGYLVQKTRGIDDHKFENPTPTY